MTALPSDIIIRASQLINCAGILRCPSWVRGLNRSRGRALRRAAWPCQRGFLLWRFAYAGPGARRTTFMGRHPQTFTETEVVPPHSINSSAATRMDCGTASPIVFAVRVLITSSN
jgi:hypothetical protein